ncbi:exopolysaccharide biosynthesis protein [Amorphus orientalis]|uniref:Exopolysaccharide biosynthesis protein n=1 Tax=Amorphus orientalis TaxID=649198 RepID=A0AAE3VRD3_9HYPH|nr:exopolysaccharide biosynthesis protein [Amorphus orientalis]MDQ0316578.1 hypothetical protein [Amorphus orientalis]
MSDTLTGTDRARSAGSKGHGTGKTRLTDLLDDLTESSGTETVGSLIKRFGARSFGPVMVLMALFAILPTGAVPGFSAVFGAVVLYLSGQLLFGLSHLALPKRLARAEIPEDKLAGLLKRVRPTARLLDKTLKPRLTGLSEKPWVRLVAAMSAAMAVSMIALAFVPFAALPPGGVMLLIGLGLVSRDGIAVLAGLACGAVWLGVLAYFAF